MGEQLSVYVAGPLYGSGHVDDNVKRALYLGEIVCAHGAVPFIPHLFMFWHFRHEHPEQWWLEMDRHWLLKCDGLFVLPGTSPGTRKEERWANKAGIPVWQMIDNKSWAVQVSEALDRFGDVGDGGSK